ncbi:MAG: carbohydrate binding domain-containing protein [Phycisphaerae bacterium]
MRKITLAAPIFAAALCAIGRAAEPIHVAFLWHMHQPIYYPYENAVQADANSRYGFSVVDIHNQRFGPYATWPRDAIQTGSLLPHLGAQVSFTGALIENLNAIRNAGVNGGMWNNWDGAYDQSRGWLTALGNRRMDLVAFGYHHPLMPLLDELDIRMQIKLHKHVYAQTWSGTGYSRGIFPPETAFSTRIIPALVAEGIEWAIVDNIHFDRACVSYPHTNASNLYAPNRADQVNPDPATTGGAWVQLNNLWAPSRVSAPFGYRPHWVQHVNPDTGVVTRMIAVPAARYEGNEDGRGGYGAFLYSTVMNQYIQYNTDPARPMLVMLHHDGDNFGGGTEAYYHSNFQNMVNWAASDPMYDVTTVDDYLERYPVPLADVIHVESGSWAGADNGDPEFKKWLGDPGSNGYSPDINSWAVLIAAKNYVFTAEQIAPAVSVANILAGTGTNTEKAWRWLLCSQASDYWYWDGQQPWDSNVTRGSNQAVAFAQLVTASGTDNTAPTVFVPQRSPYNPGAFEFGQQPESRDFEVWTLAHDISGIATVTLKWRVDADGVNPIASVQNETYAGGPEVGAWNSIAMTGSSLPNPPAGTLAATVRAQRYAATITGQSEKLIDYYVEAVDTRGNVRRSDIQHAWVGSGTTGGGGGDVVTIAPNPPAAGQNATISYNPAGRNLAGAAQVYLHYGFNQWSQTVSPDPPMIWNAATSRWTITVPVSSSAAQLDVVFNNGSGTWDNNGGADWHFAATGGQQPAWAMNGVLDTGTCGEGSQPVCLIASNGGMSLWAGVVGDVLYVATNDAGEGNDHFIYLALTPAALRAANWAKAGQIAGWDAFLADENNNDYESWFDATGTRQAATGANGGVLEGTLNLREEFGSLPTQIYAAVGAYASADGGALVPSKQVPASVNGNGNGNIDASEYVLIDLVELAGNAPVPCPEDLNGDEQINLSDLSILLANFGASSATPEQGDTDGDGDVDLTDLSRVLAIFGTACG